jgi:hypothetical protein
MEQAAQPPCTSSQSACKTALDAGTYSGADTRVQLVHSLNDQRAGGNKQRSAQRLDRKKEKDRTER